VKSEKFVVQRQRNLVQKLDLIGHLEAGAPVFDLLAG